ncbi:MAG: hypothetical protein ACLP22_14985 [Solirubrobacteraceae bacterium]
MLVAMRRVLDKIPLGQLKALRLAASGFIHRPTLLATAFLAIHDGLCRLCRLCSQVIHPFSDLKS